MIDNNVNNNKKNNNNFACIVCGKEYFDDPKICDCGGKTSKMLHLKESIFSKMRFHGEYDIDQFIKTHKR